VTWKGEVIFTLPTTGTQKGLGFTAASDLKLEGPPTDLLNIMIRSFEVGWIQIFLQRALPTVASRNYWEIPRL
jgi:hypothetical protein